MKITQKEIRQNHYPIPGMIIVSILGIVGLVVLYLAKCLLNNEHNELYLHTLTFDDNSNIKSTANHKYYVLRNNKKLWLQAKDIVFGDYVKYANGEYHQVVNNTYEIINDTVYTLSVANTHNYYVGENQVLVHNVTQIRHEAWAS